VTAWATDADRVTPVAVIGVGRIGARTVARLFDQMSDI
jgi:hypothetical protein